MICKIIVTDESPDGVILEYLNASSRVVVEDQNFQGRIHLELTGFPSPIKTLGDKLTQLAGMT